MGCCFVVGLGCSFNHALHASGALTFLCFAKDEKGDPNVQVRCANFPHCASFFRRVQTSRAARAVGQAHACFRKKNTAFGWT